MSLLMVGLSHHTAPVEVRERFAFTAPGRLTAALTALHTALGGECALLSTCNRTELYVAGERPADELIDLLTRVHGEVETPDRGCFVERRGHRAVEHLFRVAAGLESMILGENDIVRQVKAAYAEAVRLRTTGPSLNPLFHEALRVAKRARTELDIGRGAFSVGHAAAQMAVHLFGGLAGRTVLLLGAGKMSETTARHLSAAGALSLLVANRTFDRAARLAEALGGRAVPYEHLDEHLVRADIVLASTAAPQALLTRPLVEGALRARRHRPLFLIDIAVPRDIEPAVGELEEVFLYDIDDLQAMVDGDLAERRGRAVQAQALVAEEARAFSARMRAQRTAAPLVTSLRAKNRTILEDELARLRRRLPHLSDGEWRAIEAFAASVENRIAHDPTVRIKEYAAGDDVSRLATARDLFGLSEDDGA